MTGEIPDDQSVDPPNTKHHSHNNDTKQISLWMTISSSRRTKAFLFVSRLPDCVLMFLDHRRSVSITQTRLTQPSEAPHHPLSHLNEQHKQNLGESEAV